VQSKKTSDSSPSFDYIHRRPSLRCDTTNSWDPTAPKLISSCEPTTRGGRGSSRPTDLPVNGSVIAEARRREPFCERRRRRQKYIIDNDRRNCLRRRRCGAVGRRLPIRRRFRDVHVAVVENLTLSSLSSSTEAATITKNTSAVSAAEQLNPWNIH